MDNQVQNYQKGSFKEAETLSQCVIFQKITFLLISFYSTTNVKARKVTFL